MKKTKAVTIIGGADGPTSVFIVGNTRTKKKSFRQCIYQCQRNRAEKIICANPHTLQEVISYAKKKYHVVEIPKSQRIYTEQYTNLKEGLIIKHKPELLGDWAEITRPEVYNEETIKELQRQCRLRSEMVTKIPDNEMPMDFHIYEIQIEDGWMEMGIDFKWDVFGLSYSGSKKTMKNLKKAAREFYLYYGVFLSIPNEYFSNIFPAII